MPEAACILAFDIGIRNLAWCLVQAGEGSGGARILGWQNYDLLTGQGAEAPKAKVTCHRCSAAAKFRSGTAATLSCLRHCPPETPPLKDLSGGHPYTKLPGVADLRALAAAAATAAGLTPLKKSASRAQLLEFLTPRAALPLEKVKLKKAVEHELTALHDAIRVFVGAHAELFRQATHILLENQPVLKNPTMKTVQILLFATLRDMLQPGPPPLKLVHAGKKVKGEATGDAGYKSRKDASEAKVKAILTAPTAGVQEGAVWATRFQAHAKKSDLADAFCMCWDALGLPVPAAAAAAPRETGI